MKHALDTIQSLLARAETGNSPFPPTLLYEEGWMLRLVLDWFSRNPGCGEPALQFREGANWYSEGRLAAPFPPVARGDGKGEGPTSVDGAFGHIRVGGRTRADVALAPESAADGARQLVVVEAKMFSKLSSGTSNAPGYDQAARNVACMAQLLCNANRKPEEFTTLAFHVLAPRKQIKDGVFARELNKDGIKAKVKARAAAYDNPLPAGFEDIFPVMVDRMTIEPLSWESILDTITDAEKKAGKDESAGADLRAFYDKCVCFNKAASKDGAGRMAGFRTN